MPPTNKFLPGSLNKGMRRTVSLALLIGLLIYDLKYWKGNWHTAFALLISEGWQGRALAASGLLLVVGLFSAAMVFNKRSLWLVFVLAVLAFVCMGWDKLSRLEGAGTLSVAFLMIVAYITLTWLSLRSNMLTPAWVLERWKWWDSLSNKPGFQAFR